MLVYLNKKATRVCQGISVQHSESQIYQTFKISTHGQDALSMCQSAQISLLESSGKHCHDTNTNGDGTELVTSLAHKVSKILLVALKCLDITTI